MPVRRGVLDRSLEEAGRGADGARVRREVQKEGRGGRSAREVGLPAGRRVERHEPELGAGERDPGRVVGVVRIGEQDPVAALGEREGELDDRRLRPRDDRDLAVGVELDAVVVAVAAGDRLAELGQAAERRVAVDVRPRGGLRERLDDVRGRADLRVAAAEVDDRRPAVGRRGGDAAEQRAEVLLGQPVEAAWPRAP